MKNIFDSTIPYCEKLIICLLCAVTFIIPVFFDIRLFSAFDLSKVTTLYLLILIILVIWSIILIFKQDFKFPHTPLNLPVLIYICFFIISTVLSINPIISFLGAYKRFEGLTSTLCYIFIFYAIVNFVTTRKRLYLIIFTFVASAVVSSCYGISQHLGFDMVKWSEPNPRVSSTFGSPVFFSVYLVMVLPSAVILFLSKSFQQKETATKKNSNIFWIFIVSAMIIYTAFWLTNTRACFVALVVVIIPLLFLVFKRTNDKYKYAILVISFILIGIFFNGRQETSVIKRFKNEVDITVPSKEKLAFNKIMTHRKPVIANTFSFTGTSLSRIYQYLTAINIIKDYPLFGIGPDTIGIVYQKYLAEVFTLKEDYRGFPFSIQDRIHNDILDTTVTRGIFGLGTYIWLLVAFGIYIYKNYWKLSNQNKMLILGLLAGIVSYLIQNEFSFGNTPITTLLWTMKGLCISIIRINNGKEEVPNEFKLRFDVKLSFYKVFIFGLTLIAMCFVSIYIMRIYRADAYYERGRRILTSEGRILNTSTKRGLNFIKKAIKLNPYETFYRDELCRTYIQFTLKTKNKVFIQKALTETNNTLELIPQHFIGFFHLGLIYQMMDELFNYNTTASAIQYYKKAIELDPFQSSPHSNLASIYINKEYLDLAIEEMYQTYLISHKKVKQVNNLINAYLQKGDLKNALIFAKKAVKLNPEESDNYNTIGNIYKSKKQYVYALQSFKKAVKLLPDNPVYTYNLANCYFEQNNYNKAKEILLMFNKTHPNHNYIDILLLLARVHSINADWEKVISECEDAVKINEKSISAYKMMGAAYYNTRNYKLAEKMLNQVIVLNPDDQEVKHLLSIILDKTREGL